MAGLVVPVHVEVLPVGHIPVQDGLQGHFESGEGEAGGASLAARGHGLQEPWVDGELSLPHQVTLELSGADCPRGQGGLEVGVGGRGRLGLDVDPNVIIVVQQSATDTRQV